MLSWWTNMESVAALYNVLMFATIVLALLSGILVFLSTRRLRKRIIRLNDDLAASRKQVKALEKTAESIRRELLESQQHQDISQLKLKTSKSSSDELRQALLDARKRLQIAEEAVRVHQQTKETGSPPPTSADTGSGEFEPLDLELEIEGGLSQNQRDQLIDLLDPGPKGNLDIFCIMGDEQSEMTAKQIDEVLTADGWKTNGVAHSAFSTAPNGLLLVVNSKETAPSYASFLQRVFSTIGLTVSAKIDKKYREWSLSVIVGRIDE